MTDSAQIEPIHVVMDQKPEEHEAPTFGSWQLFSWGANVSAIVSATPILPQADRRDEAQVIVVGVPVTTTPAVNAIALPASTVAGYNNNSTGVNVTVAGGTVSQIAINGVNTNLTSGTFFVPAGGTITLTYTVGPTTFTTAGIPVTGVASGAFARIGTQAQVMNNAGAPVPPGTRIPVHNAHQLWAASDGVNPMQILVLDERYD